MFYSYCQVNNFDASESVADELIAAAAAGETARFTQLLADIEFETRYKWNLEFIIGDRQRFDRLITARNNAALFLAVKNGHWWIVSTLLTLDVIQNNTQLLRAARLKAIAYKQYSVEHLFDVVSMRNKVTNPFEELFAIQVNLTFICDEPNILADFIQTYGIADFKHFVRSNNTSAAKSLQKLFLDYKLDNLILLAHVISLTAARDDINRITLEYYASQKRNPLEEIITNELNLIPAIKDPRIIIDLVMNHIGPLLYDKIRSGNLELVFKAFANPMLISVPDILQNAYILALVYKRLELMNLLQDINLQDVLDPLERALKYQLIDAVNYFIINNDDLLKTFTASNVTAFALAAELHYDEELLGMILEHAFKTPCNDQQQDIYRAYLFYSIEHKLSKTAAALINRLPQQVLDTYHDNKSLISTVVNSRDNALLSILLNKKYNVFPEQILSASFKVINDRGHGHFGKITQVEHATISTQQFVLKSCINIKANSEIVNELLVLYDLNHPNIVELYGAYFDNPALNIVIEYIDGYDLYNYYSNTLNKLDTKPRLAFVCKVLPQIREAITYIAERHYAHLDLKPENVMIRIINDRIEVKLIDFGFATKFGTKTFNIGTLVYNAPEMIKHRLITNKYNAHINAHGVSSKQDVYGYGAIAYVISVGRYMFRYDKGHLKTAHAIINDAPEWPQEFNDPIFHQFKAHVNQALIKDPDKRPTISTLPTYKFEF